MSILLYDAVKSINLVENL